MLVQGVGRMDPLVRYSVQRPVKKSDSNLHIDSDMDVPVCAFLHVAAIVRARNETKSTNKSIK